MKYHKTTIMIKMKYHKMKYHKTYIPTVIYELYGRSRNTTGLLYSIFGLRVPDDGTATFYREIKLKMGFGGVHCCLDMGGLRLQRATETDIQ